jgi:hypothetical protein
MTAREPTSGYPPTADRLRHDISRGKAGDKVDHPDLAAAPLGTDDEAVVLPARAAYSHSASESSRYD